MISWGSHTAPLLILIQSRCSEMDLIYTRPLSAKHYILILLLGSVIIYMAAYMALFSSDKAQ